MSLIARELQDVWDALGAGNGQRDDALAEIRIRNLRGIRDLRVPFDYPVCVLAGPNACAKSTVLFACACAYQVPGRRPREFIPSTRFSNFTNRQQQPELPDTEPRTELEFHYLDRGNRGSMAWRRGKSWNRSFLGRAGGAQPVRDVYLRTLANRTNQSEVRSITQLARKQIEARTLSAEMLIFAYRILSWRYRNLGVISARATNDLLFAALDDVASTGYSESHMSSSERAILRISRDISHLRNALVLIDEVDTGLHPYTQQQTMLEVQRSALRNDLQVIVASHSPVVLDSVPPHARIFLERDETAGEVRRAPLYRDILQKALYGQSRFAGRPHRVDRRMRRL
jgi:predicted ATP-dependent endonuclease of OLD family